MPPRDRVANVAHRANADPGRGTASQRLRSGRSLSDSSSPTSFAGASEMLANLHRRPSHRRCAPVVLLALLLSPGDAGAQELNPAPETFLRLTGIVRDARTGEGIAGASVTVAWGSVDEWVLADSAGRY